MNSPLLLASFVLRFVATLGPASAVEPPEEYNLQKDLGIGGLHDPEGNPIELWRSKEPE